MYITLEIRQKPKAPGAQALSPLILLASWMSFGIMVTLFAWMAQRLVSSNSPTRYASAASCSASTAWLWNRRSVCTKVHSVTSVAHEKEKENNSQKYHELFWDPLRVLHKNITNKTIFIQKIIQTFTSAKKTLYSVKKTTHELKTTWIVWSYKLNKKDHKFSDESINRHEVYI